MVLVNHILELGQQLRGLLGSQLIDELRERACSEDALPTRDRVRANHGVHCSQVLPDILWIATRLLVDVDMFRVRSCSFDKAITYEGRRQALEELLVSWREPVVKLISGCP